MANQEEVEGGEEKEEKEGHAAASAPAAAGQSVLLPRSTAVVPRQRPLRRVLEDRWGDAGGSAHAESSWQKYNEFRASPGEKCSDCWMPRRCCCCNSELPRVELRPKVCLVMHPREIGQHRGSNTAKLLLGWGAELFVWGHPEHERRLEQLIAENASSAVVLFPSDGACAVPELSQRGRLPLRFVIVLDGSWRETKKMNLAVDSRIPRCVVTVTREEYGVTRKYTEEVACQERAQTAAAFVALMKEAGEDVATVSALTQRLTWYMACYQSVVQWDKDGASLRRSSEARRK